MEAVAIRALLQAAEEIDPPRANAKLLKEIEKVNDDLAGLVMDYRDVKRADYESGEDGADDFHADREEIWDSIHLELMDAVDSLEEDES